MRLVRIPLIADTHSKLIADTVPRDRGHRRWGAWVTGAIVVQLSTINAEHCPRSAWNEGRVVHAAPLGRRVDNPVPKASWIDVWCPPLQPCPRRRASLATNDRRGGQGVADAPAVGGAL